MYLSQRPACSQFSTCMYLQQDTSEPVHAKNYLGYMIQGHMHAERLAHKAEPGHYCSLEQTLSDRLQ